ncbi:hypothetical protein R2601_04003 [Salipiger bermudensis HTCC2601]|uniref:Uncharacterized protein n=1 Tax=Salipiger bermudensis (strain DSM 26914 / JCM 13377 / KCTC 12554 / HTCC2601) TaxID=314265 RepID=Q0FW45_SALBH|nr:hypothetical protein R2601_04003 [Salipiger bermudensis HTCC2601]
MPGSPVSQTAPLTAWPTPSKPMRSAIGPSVP